MGCIMTFNMVEPRAPHWTRERHYVLAADGGLVGRRVQFIRGQIAEMPPQRHSHCGVIARTARWLERTFGQSHWVRTLARPDVNDELVPEPDLAVTEHPMKNYREQAKTAFVVVDEADSSLRIEREKAQLYAWAGMPEYWIVNLNTCGLQVYRNPILLPGDQGTCHLDAFDVGTEELISPLASPEAQIGVAVWTT